ncbi:unnamed protein product [Colias eurytheme]|nr:unnamed protein product [Colias eurytheme]
MLTQVTLISIILTSVAIQAKQLDRGPQTFTNTNDSSAGAAQNQQKRFASKGIIVYLTADQIKEFQAGKMELQSLSSGEISISRRPNVRKLQQQNSQSRFNSHRENLNILKAPLVHKSQLVDIEQEQQGEGYVNAPNRLPLNRGGLTPQLLLFSPDNQRPEIQSNEKTQQSNKNKLSPRNPVKQENSEEQYLQEQIKKNQPESSNQEAQQQEVANYNSLLNALVRGNLLREQNNATENQQSSEQENALGNLSPVIIQKEVHITQHKHVPVVKHVKVPVPTPVLVPILHPYEVRVPQPYPVPAEANARVPTQERNAERNVQENTERNVQRNSVRNAERNAERDAVRNAERNAEENAENNAESTAERNAERNPESAEVQRVPFELRHHGKNVYINVDSPAYLQLWKHK